MEIAIVLPQPHGNSEQIGKMLLGKDRGLRPIGKDASCAQEDHAFDLWKDLGYVVRNQQDTEPGLSKLAHGVSKLDLCTSARAISVRLASPEDISATARSARCPTPSRHKVSSARARSFGSG